MKPERTLVLLKPDTVQRCVSGEIISRFERIGLKMVGMKMKWVDPDFSKKHYEEHVDKSFYKFLEEYIIYGPIIAMVLEGAEAVNIVRKMVGDKDSKIAVPGTIRGDYSHMALAYANAKDQIHTNLIHASANPEEAEREINLWFKPEEMHSYKTVHEHLVM